ncbi:MAG: 30S ribosomal protein S6 [Pirellulales bacterium]|nr:30S ribosomal protein S6 [Pirellulales bacterium]
MAVSTYEGMFILDANRFGRDPESVSGQVPAMIEKLGGEMLVSRLWEERRLAYPIKGQRKGAYWLTYFRLDGERLADLKRQCRIAEDVLRSLILKVDPRIADALVAHAKTASVAPRSEAENPPADAVADDADNADNADDSEEDIEIEE